MLSADTELENTIITVEVSISRSNFSFVNQISIEHFLHVKCPSRPLFSKLWAWWNAILNTYSN